MPKYNGHSSYNAWNVNLWINNDEHLYNMAKWMVKIAKDKNDAAKRLKDLLPDTTPDGVKYTISNVRKALIEM